MGDLTCWPLPGMLLVRQCLMLSGNLLQKCALVFEFCGSLHALLLFVYLMECCILCFVSCKGFQPEKTCCIKKKYLNSNKTKKNEETV